MLPGLPIEFTEPPRRCPVCGGCVWRDDVRRMLGEIESYYINFGEVCATCVPERRPRRRLATVRDADPDAGNINHGY